MKLCAFGNSYIVAIKHAIEDSALNGSVTFVGRCLPGEFSISVAGDVVTPRPGSLLSFAEGKGPDILLSDYDAFLIVGLKLSFQHAAKMYTRHRLWQHAAGDSHIVSEAALSAAIKDQLSLSVAADLARSLRQFTDKPIFLIPEPNPIEEIKRIPLTNDRLKKAFESFQAVFQDEVGIEVYNAFVRAAEAVANDLSAKFLPQPADTLTPVFSDNRYRVEIRPKFTPLPGSPGPPEEGDIFHLNALFGHHVVKQIEPLLTVTSGRESAPPASRL